MDTHAATTPPFRADHVGSLLRPRALKEAREAHNAGKITAQQLRETEDRAIRDVVRLQEDLGLQGITDGEFLRGVRYYGGGARTHSVVMRLASGTVRYIESSHRWDKLMRISSLQYAPRS